MTRGPGRSESRSVPLAGRRARCSISEASNGKALGWQIDLLQQQRLSVGEAEPFEVQGRRGHHELERFGHLLACSLGPGGDHPGLRVQAAGLHLVGEAHRSGEVTLYRGPEDGGAPVLASAADVARGQLGQGSSDGDQAAAVAVGQLALGRKTVTGRPFPGLESCPSGRDRPGDGGGQGLALGGIGSLLRPPKHDAQL